MKVIAHVSQPTIAKNRKEGTFDPVLTVKTYKSNDKVYEAVFDGPVHLVYSPHVPLSCGARVYMTTEGQVTLLDQDGSIIKVLNPKITEE